MDFVQGVLGFLNGHTGDLDPVNIDLATQRDVLGLGFLQAIRGRTCAAPANSSRISMNWIKMVGFMAGSFLDDMYQYAQYASFSCILDWVGLQ